ncbi:MAG: hypothetical protein FVQ82_16985 [Planctomycetes bacterium]|nr:hypothetical protein [Planctomycetota bacterium]
MPDRMDERRAKRWEALQKIFEKHKKLAGAAEKANAAGQKIDETVHEGLKKAGEKIQKQIEKERQKSNLSPYIINAFERITQEPIAIDNPYWNTGKYTNKSNWYLEKKADEVIKKLEEEKKRARKEETKKINERYLKALKGQTESKGSDRYKNIRPAETLEEYDIPVF